MNEADTREELDLSGHGLSVLPGEEELSRRRDHLCRLLASNNEVAVVPPALTSWLPNLTVLHLSNNHLCKLPSLSALSRLTHLFLAENSLSDWPPGLPESLVALDLGWNSITRVPADLGRLVRLERLSLWNNKLISVSPEIGRLICLRSLWLDGNRLVSLPHEVAQLPSLVDLQTGDNLFSSSALTAASEGGDGNVVRDVLLSEFNASCKRPTHVKAFLLGDSGTGKSEIVSLIADVAPAAAKAGGLKPPGSAGTSARPVKLSAIEEKRASSQRLAVPGTGAGGRSRASSRGSSGGGQAGAITGTQVEESSFVTKCGRGKLTVHLVEIGGSRELAPVMDLLVQEKNAVYLITYNVFSQPNVEYWIKLVESHTDPANTSILLLGTYLEDNPRANEKFLERHVETMQKNCEPIGKVRGIMTIPIKVKGPATQDLKDLISKAFATSQLSAIPVHPSLEHVVAQIAKLRSQVCSGKSSSVPVLSWSQLRSSVITKDSDLSEGDLRKVVTVLHQCGILMYFAPSELPTSRVSQRTLTVPNQRGGSTSRPPSRLSSASKPSTPAPVAEPYTPSPETIALRDFYRQLFRDTVILDPSWLSRKVASVCSLIRESHPQEDSSPPSTIDHYLSAVQSEVSPLLPPPQ